MFQSDYDYDIVDNLDEEAGLHKLAAEANEALAKSKKPFEGKGDKEVGVHYSVFADHCPSKEAVEVVKKHMNAGMLAQLVAKYEGKMNGPDSAKDWHPPQYVLVLIGACAMTLGCTLPPPFVALLKKIYASTGLMDEAKMQMRKALHGPNGYVNGTAYNFGSLGLMDTMSQGMSSGGHGKKQGGFTMMNVQSPGGLPPLSPEDIADLRRKMHGENNAPQAQPEYGPDVCGGCGKTQGEGGKELMKCAGTCGGRTYCGKACQKKHWKLHKGVCKVPKTTGQQA